MQKYLKPREGMQIHDPQRGDYLPPTGRLVEFGDYWFRRERDGDVKETEPPAEEAPAEDQAAGQPDAAE